MKRSVVFAALYVAFAVGAVATCLFGRAGIASHRSLERYAAVLRENIAELEKRNGELAEELRLLQADAETVRLLARDLGYFAADERRVVIEGYAPARRPLETGHVVQAAPAAPEGRRLETLYLVPLFLLLLGLCADVGSARDG